MIGYLALARETFDVEYAESSLRLQNHFYCHYRQMQLALKIS